MQNKLEINLKCNNLKNDTNFIYYEILSITLFFVSLATYDVVNMEVYFEKGYFVSWFIYANTYFCSLEILFLFNLISCTSHRLKAFNNVLLEKLRKKKSDFRINGLSKNERMKIENEIWNIDEFTVVYDVTICLFDVIWLINDAFGFSMMTYSLINLTGLISCWGQVLEYTSIAVSFNGIGWTCYLLVSKRLFNV